MISDKSIICIMNKEIDLSNELVVRDAVFSLGATNDFGLVLPIRQPQKDDAERYKKGTNARKLCKGKYATDIRTSQYVEVISGVWEGNSVCR